ncbi:MAG: DUF3082 domain-containing protein [Pleurocapsa sp.]
MTDIEPSDNTQISSQESSQKSVTLLRCLVASMISGGIAFGLYSLMNSIVQTYATKPIISANPTALRIAVAVRTLVVGVAALGTGVFGLVAVGLLLLGIQTAIINLKQGRKSGEV